MPFIHKYKLHFSIGFLSAAIIAFQLALMQILSIIQWYHFAYMIISVALLGFGAAGTILALFKEKLLRHIRGLLPLLMISSGIAMSLVMDIAQVASIRFDSYLLFADYSHFWRLMLTYLLFFTPFFLGALAIGLIFVQHVDEIGKIYFANLLGSGTGGILALLLISMFFPWQIPAFIGMLSLLAGIILIPRTKIFFHLVIAIAGIIVITWKISDPPRLILSQYKDLSKTLLLPASKITWERASAYGLAQTVSSPVLRYAPGLSLTAQTTAKIKMAAFVNGDWFGAVTERHNNDSAFILDYTSFALPYIMTERNSVLVLKAGSGMDVNHASSRGAKKIVAVEPNLTMLSRLIDESVESADHLFHQPGTSFHYMEPRTFLMINDSGYDLISLPVVGTFGGSAGLYALQEQFILTKEAVREMWFKLNPEGAISITSWMDYPVRNPLKILATLVEVLEEVGIQNPKEHIASIRSWASISFVMKRSPITKQEIQNIRNFCERMLFDPAILPGLHTSERARYNQFQDDRFFEYTEKIFTSGRNELYEDYDFNIRPATDNKPYFSQFIRWENLNRLAGIFGNRSIPFFEVGYLLLMITLIQIAVISFVLILLPLFKTGVKRKNIFPILLYFGGIGLGYMFVEMVFIQRFILYFGSPVYAASAVITFLLICSGTGSYYSNYFPGKKRLTLVLALIIFVLVTYAFALTPLLQQTIHFGLVYKLLIGFLLIAPLAFFLGIPFPAGLSRISKMNSRELPWAWGLNGCVSVISTALATLVAVEMGFIWVMLFAALAYCLPLGMTSFRKDVIP